jgi:hypothetical protein
VLLLLLRCQVQAPATPPGGAEPEQQVWIVQEYCAKGSLLEAVDRGLLRPDGPNLPAILACAQEIAGMAIMLSCALFAWCMRPCWQFARLPATHLACLPARRSFLPCPRLAPPPASWR